MVQALSVARTCVMLNAYEAIFFSLPRDQSLGSATATEPQRGLQYYRTFTHPDSVLASLLVPNVYASQHNMVAHDFKKFLPMYGNLFRRHVKRPGCLLAMKLRRRVAERRARWLRTRDKILDTTPPATFQTFATASLEQAIEQAIEHVASGDGQNGQEAVPDRCPALWFGRLDP